MNRTDLYFKSTKILIDSYQNEILFHHTWTACAVGQLVAGNLGFVVLPHCFCGGVTAVNWESDGKLISMAVKFGCLLRARTYFARKKLHLDFGDEKYQRYRNYLASTGYTHRELRKISTAFDDCSDQVDNTKNLLAGLKAALAMLKIIHRVSTRDINVHFKKAFEQEKNLIAILKDEKYGWISRYQQSWKYDYISYLREKQAEVKFTSTKILLNERTTRLSDVGVMASV